MSTVNYMLLFIFFYRIYWTVVFSHYWDQRIKISFIKIILYSEWNGAIRLVRTYLTTLWKIYRSKRNCWVQKYRTIFIDELENCLFRFIFCKYLKYSVVLDDFVACLCSDKWLLMAVLFKNYRISVYLVFRKGKERIISKKEQKVNRWINKVGIFC